MLINLNKSSVLNEKLSKEELKKYYWDNELFDYVYDKFNLRFPKGKDAYIKWLLKISDTPRFKEDLFRALNAIDVVFRKNLKPNLGKLKSIHDLEDFVESKVIEEPTTSKRQEKLEKKNEGVKKFLYDDDNWLVLIPSEAGCFYAKGTRWCTTQDEMFNEYSKEGPLFIVINKKIKDSKGRNKKYQFHFETDSFNDQNDREVKHTRLGIPSDVWKAINKEDPNIKLDSKGNLTYKKVYHKNGNVRYERWFLNDKLHREDGPAVIDYHKNGKVEYERWFLNDKLHREDGPAYIGYYENGNIEVEEWILNDKRHREDGPAFISYYDNGNVKSKRWFLNGKRHREDGPAYIYYYDNGNVKSKRWFLNGKFHRKGGPAIINYYKNGNVEYESWHLNGEEIEPPIRESTTIYNISKPLIERYESARRIKNRTGTELTFIDIYKIIKDIPFIHATSLTSIKDIAKVGDLLSADRLTKDLKISPSHTYYIDEYFKTHENVFYSFGNYNKLFSIQPDIMFGLSPSKANSIGGYVQMNDVWNIFEKAVQGEEDDIDITFTGLDKQAFIGLGEDIIETIKAKMHKSRMSVREFLILTSYLMLRLASHKKINNIEILINKYFKIISEESELHIYGSVPVDEHSFIVKAKNPNTFMPIKEREKLNTIIKSIGIPAYVIDVEKNAVIKLIKALRKSKKTNISERFDEAHRIKKRKGTNLTYKQIFDVMKNLPFVHKTNDKKLDSIIKKGELLSSKQMAGLGGTSTTFGLDWYFNTIENVFFSYGREIIDGTIGFCIRPKTAVKLDGYIQIKDVLEYWNKFSADFNVDGFISYREYSDVREKEEKLVKYIKGFISKKRLSVADFIKFVSYMALRFASKNNINSIDKLITDFFSSSDNKFELQIKDKVKIDDIDFITVSEAVSERTAEALRPVRSKVIANKGATFKNFPIDLYHLSIGESLNESPYDSPNKTHVKRIHNKDFLKLLRHQILSRLFNGLVSYFEKDPEYCKVLENCLKNYSDSIKLIGGFLTKFATDDSDIDVSVFLKDDILSRVDEDKTVAIKKIKDYFNDKVNGKDLSDRYDYDINFFFMEDEPKFNRHGIELFGDEIKKKEVEDVLDEKMVDVTKYLSKEKFAKYIFIPLKKTIKLIEKMVENRNIDDSNKLKDIYKITDRVGGKVFEEFKKFDKDLKIYHYTSDNLRYKALKEGSDVYHFIKFAQHKNLDGLRYFLKNKKYKLNTNFEDSLATQIVQKVLKNKVNESIVLNERTISKNEIQGRKKNSKISEYVWKVIFELDPKKTENTISEYSEWMANILRTDYQYDERRFIEDAYKFQEAFSKFKGDLFKYKTLNDLLDVVEEEPIVSKRQEKLEKKNEGVKKFLYNDDNWLVLIPSEAGCFYAKGTRWCTTQDRMFKEYSEEGPLFIVIDRKTNKKYQFHFETNSFMDQNDREVNRLKLGIPSDVWKAVDKENPNIKLDSKGNLTYKKIYYDNGNIESERWYLNGKLHRENGPAVVDYYYENGNVKYERWYLNDEYHREDGPAVIYYYEDGNVKYEEWYLNGKLHREDGPAYVGYYEDGNVVLKRWYLDDKLHREDGPAYIDYYEDGNIESERWFLNGKKVEPRKK